MEGFCLRFNFVRGPLERVYGERVSGEDGDLERVSTGRLRPETEINLFGDIMERIVW